MSGTWYSKYDGKTVASASGIDIDHSQLIAVSAGSNRAKGDKDSGNWKPALESYQCTYSRAWIGMKSGYALTANAAAVDALSQMLDTCDA
ncbi:hypothetical protein [Streptomyces sp. NPDC018000]|uniref:hypothetical protein n=1 Tax=Streptomyces sp. NPDC018000 TaxID=3365028 RepID=UPI0037A68A1C